MEKLKRAVVRANMKKPGLIRISKKNGGSSFFSLYWREYVRKGDKNAKGGGRAVRKAKRAVSQVH